jgi:hypothetical protein
MSGGLYARQETRRKPGRKPEKTGTFGILGMTSPTFRFFSPAHVHLWPLPGAAPMSEH